MPIPPRAVSLAILLGAFMGAEATHAADPRPLDVATVAKRPAPGTVVPGGFEYTPDSSAVSYLKSENASLDRVLWRVNTRDGKAPVVVARPPGAGNTDANVSLEEALRRERMRQVDTGITTVIRAKNADISIIPLNSDLYLQRGTGPLERLTNTPAPEIDPKLNPEGTKVAFVRDKELYVLDIATRKETQLSQGATDAISHGLAEFMAEEEMDRHTGYWWSPDGANIVYQETDERLIPLYTIVHEGSAKPSVETHRYPFPGAANAKVKLGVVAATGGETVWLDLEQPGRDYYIARVDWESPRDIVVQVLQRDQAELNLIRINARTGQTHWLLTEKSASWINLTHDFHSLPQGQFLWTSERSGFKHIELHDKDGDLLKTLTAGDFVVDAIESVDIARREVWYTSNAASPLEARLYRVSFDGGEAMLVTPEAGTHKCVVAPDGNTFVDTFSDLNHPPLTRLRDRDGKPIATLDDAATDPRLASLSLPSPEMHTFKNREGVTLFGAYYAPKSRLLGNKAPLIVMLYGGPHVQYVTNAWAMTADLRAQYFTQSGFAVWKMDNRGSARRGLAFESALHKNMGTPEVLDQVDGVKFITARYAGDIDSKRVGVNGRSYGGYMTLRCLEFAPEVFHAGVAEAPVTDWDGYDTCYTERYMSTPEKNPAGYKAASTLPYATQMRGKLLIMHGLIDENVHFRHTARLVEALVAAGKSFEVLPMPEERHSSRKPQNRIFEVERLVRFFESALKPPG